LHTFTAVIMAMTSQTDVEKTGPGADAAHVENLSSKGSDHHAHEAPELSETVTLKTWLVIFVRTLCRHLSPPNLICGDKSLTSK
jgi:hypothetical protein